MSPVPVLIVGAGPTGLMMACQLSRYNIPFRIIDKNKGPSEKSKALAVQARTLEIYAQMGLADRVIEEGHQATGVNFILKGKKIVRLPVMDIGKELSPYPFMHIFEQNKNERLLIGFLQQKNIFVEWETELISLVQHEKEVTAVVQKNGKQERLISSWVFGADGGKSKVRHILNLPFEGDTYENIFYVADTGVNWDVGYGELFLYISKKTFAGFFPMKGEKRFRLVGILPKQFRNEDSVTFDDIQSTIKTQLESSIDFFDTSWFAVYRLHHRCVNSFRSGRCFLGGDAAHIHSPAGGQGMNTGLQDAYNLAWKLALVIQDKASEKILDTYNAERLPFAKRLVNTTDRAFGFMVNQNFFVRLVRLNIFPLLARAVMGISAFRKFAFKTVSQLGINYRSSRLSVAGASGSSKFKAGDRIPYCLIYDEKNKKMISLFELLTAPGFHILVFDKNNSLVERINSLVTDLNQKYPQLFKRSVIHYREENKKAFDTLGIKNSLVCIVRPDNYAGYISNTINGEEIKKYLEATIGLF